MVLFVSMPRLQALNASHRLGLLGVECSRGQPIKALFIFKKISRDMEHRVAKVQPGETRSSSVIKCIFIWYSCRLMRNPSWKIGEQRVAGTLGVSCLLCSSL